MDDRYVKPEDWIVQATRQIRFKPDRVAVAEELREHIEDHVADLERLYPDMPVRERNQRALRYMGDAQELGRELARIHRPWLGYLWRVSQIVLGVVLLVSVIVSINRLGGGWNGWYDKGHGVTLREYEKAESYVWLEPNSKPAYVQGYRVSVEEVLKVRWSDESDELRILLRTMSPYFWDRTGSTQDEHITAVDSLGNHYVTYEEYRNGEYPFPGKCVVGHGDGNGPFHQDYVLWVQFLDARAEWLRLEYDWLGRRFSIIIDLKEERA